MNYYVYAIYNSRYNKIYIGQTVDLVARLKQHNDPSFKKFTSRYPGGWNLIHEEQFLTRSDAITRERQLKSYQGRKFIKNKINIPG